MSQPAARVFVTAALFLTAIAGIASQSPATRQTATPPVSQTGTGVIAGQLVDGSSGAPVTTAIVTLWPPNAPVSLGADGVPLRNQVTPTTVVQPLKTLVDASGRFVFHSLPPGSYALGATRPGYLPTFLGQTQPNAATAGRRLELSDTGRLTNVTLKIWKVASVSGTIVDEAGEPAVGTTVRLLYAGSSPVNKYRNAAVNRTDDRGMFRFGSLTPGDYLVVVPSMIVAVPLETAAAFATAMNEGAQALSAVSRELVASGVQVSPSGTRVGDVLIQISTGQGGVIAPVIVRDDGKAWAYPAMYYPAARAISSATTITVRSGEARTGINIAVHPVPAVIVSGLVSGAAGPMPNTAVSFVPAGMEDKPTAPGAGTEVAQAITRRDGTFTALLPAGDYTASVFRSDATQARGGPPPAGPSEPALWGLTKVSASGTRVDGITIRLAEGMTVGGRVEFEPGVAAVPSAAVLQRVRVLVTQVEGASGVRPFSATLAADRSFRTPGFPPGSYSVAVTVPSADWMLKSITSAGRDLTVDPLVISATSVEGVVLTFTDKAGEVSGTVARSDAGDVYVMLVPVSPRATPPLDLRRMRSVVSGDNTFRFPGVLPGDYAIVAVTGNPLSESAQRLSSWASRGTTFTLGEREKRTLSLSVIK